MKSAIYSYTAWPRTKGGSPIFTCSEDAIFYAHLIMDKVQERSNIARLRQRTLAALKVMRHNDNPNLQRMMNLAVTGQFYRECLEEVERTEKEVDR